MLTPADKLQFLQQTELFSELPQTELEAICQIANEVTYPADATLFEEGDEGDSLYLMVNGKVSIIKAGTEVLFFDEKGYCLGEIALIDNKPRSATVKTVEPTQLLRITRHDFYNAMARQPQRIVRGMFRVLNDKIRRDLEIQRSAIRKEIAQEESMRLAAEIQKSLLPNQEISHAYVSSAGYCQPANSVGGDYYDYLNLSDNSVAIFLGDVMGHGYHSAMIAAMTKSCLQTQIRFDASIPEVMKAITGVIEASQTFIFMTCCYLIIHADNRFEFANAAHPQMLLYREHNGDILELKSEFMPVGFPQFSEPSEYYSTEIEWHPGDLLVLYSDGITEALNPDAEMYGVERFQALISQKRQLSPMEIKAEILSDLQAHQQDERADDDITLVVAKFN